jgi:hypothetical protein
MIKNKYKTLETLSLPNNRLKSFTSNKSTRVEFIDETYKHKKELSTIYKNWENFAPPLFNAQINKKMQGVQIVIVFTFFADYLAN